jgi:RimJ/RimL family protein N-acetyltransferase
LSTAIETDRLLLHPWREADRPELERLWSDPVVQGGRDLPPARIGAIAEESLRQWRVNGSGHWKSLRVPVVGYAIERSVWKRDRA